MFPKNVEVAKPQRNGAVHGIEFLDRDQTLGIRVRRRPQEHSAKRTEHC